MNGIISNSAINNLSKRICGRSTILGCSTISSFTKNKYRFNIQIYVYLIGAQVDIITVAWWW